MINFANTSQVTRIEISYSQLHNPEVANTRFWYKPDDITMTQQSANTGPIVPIVRI